MAVQKAKAGAVPKVPQGELSKTHKHEPGRTHIYFGHDPYIQPRLFAQSIAQYARSPNPVDPTGKTLYPEFQTRFAIFPVDHQRKQAVTRIQLMRDGLDNELALIESRPFIEVTEGLHFGVTYQRFVRDTKGQPVAVDGPIDVHYAAFPGEACRAVDFLLKDVR